MSDDDNDVAGIVSRRVHPGPDTAPDLAALRETVAEALRYWVPDLARDGYTDGSGAARAADAVLAALAPHVTAQVEQRDARIRELEAERGDWQGMARIEVRERLGQLRNERDAALARVDAARRDALTEAADEWERLYGWLTVSTWLRARAAVESPDQPEGQR